MKSNRLAEEKKNSLMLTNAKNRIVEYQLSNATRIVKYKLTYATRIVTTERLHVSSHS